MLTLLLTLLGWGAEGQGNGRDKVPSHTVLPSSCPECMVRVCCVGTAEKDASRKINVRTR